MLSFFSTLLRHLLTTKSGGNSTYECMSMKECGFLVQTW